MTRRHLAAAALAATSLIFGSLACGGKGDGPPKEAFPPLGQPAKLKLVGAEGAAAPEGARALRWKAEKGASASLKMTMDMKTEVKAQGQTMPVNMAMSMDMDGKIEEVMPDGSAKVSMVVKGASMEMPMAGAAATSAVSDQLKGLTITSTMDPRGNMKGTEVSGGGDLLGDLGNQMNDSLDQMAIPFPEEPVAVGSQWEALTTQQVNNMKVRMRAVYELTELEGDKGTVKLTIQQFADPQTVNMNGTSADIKSMKSSGGGEVKFDLSRPMFTDADLTLKMSAEMEIMGHDAEMKVDARVAMKPGA